MCCLAVKVNLCGWKAPEQALPLYPTPCAQTRDTLKPILSPQVHQLPLPKLRAISCTLKDESLLLLPFAQPKSINMS